MQVKGGCRIPEPVQSFDQFPDVDRPVLVNIEQIKKDFQFKALDAEYIDLESGVWIIDALQPLFFAEPLWSESISSKSFITSWTITFFKSFSFASRTDRSVLPRWIASTKTMPVTMFKIEKYMKQMQKKKKDKIGDSEALSDRGHLAP